MIDEYFERLVDRLCRSVPRFLRPRMTLLSNSGVGWRLSLYFGTMGRKIAGAFSHISNEDNMDLFLRETAERGDDGFARIAAFLKEQISLLMRLDARGRNIRFDALLLMLMMAAAGVCLRGGPALAVTAASLCVMWLATAVESGYEPVSRGIRQQYLAYTMLRVLAAAILLPYYFLSYAAGGVPSNVLLQSAMIAMLTIHLVLYLALVIFNTRQMLFLRALSGVLGCIPALMAAAAIAHAAAYLFAPWPLPLSGVLSALGAVMIFLGDELITITHLGGIRLKHNAIWVCLLVTAGYACTLAGAWNSMP